MLNKVMLIGNLGKDPETRAMPNGQPVSNVSLATTFRWKDKNGDRQEQTEWHNVVFFGSLASVAEQYLSKGSKVYVEGRIKTEKYQTKEGETRYSTKIVAEHLTMLDGAPKGEGSGGRRSSDERGDSGGYDASDIPF